MTFEEAKARPDYKFIPVCEQTLRQVQNRHMEYMSSDGSPSFGEAVLEIGYVDIELNITTPCLCDDNPTKPDDQTPVLDYFCCVKKQNNEWVPYGYLETWDAEKYKVHVDWNAPDWQRQLEEEMFHTLMSFCQQEGITINTPNSDGWITEKETRKAKIDEKPIWNEDNFDFSSVAIGDYVDAAVVMNTMNCMPPACMRLDCAQLGEPYSHREDPETHRLRPTFATFKAVRGNFDHGVWQYCGHCFRGENLVRGTDPIYC